ncbi:ADP-ribosylglycohydrolase family protein [Dietzia sp. 179-F 9C3 NHS]|uniref:ADP-ribosylglycohydrolase family protein n=1 Tax=Dietzia sp. 179-F 9C3 NHS TaxID=3374295 RepID=UPI00387A5456
MQTRRAPTGPRWSTWLTRPRTAALRSRYTNALIGGAAGDAWGYQVEFTPYARMPSYPVARPRGQWVISDDTQMLLATHYALTDVDDFEDIDAVADALIDRYLDWMVDPDNTRAPGTTCMSALATIDAGAPWNQGGARRSAGCGAVMRLAPAAFAPPAYRRGLSVLQAAITHKHPMAVLSALLLCDAFTDATTSSTELLAAAQARLHALQGGMPAEWAHDAYLRRVLALLTDDPAGYLAAGAAREPGRTSPSLVEVFAAARHRLETETAAAGWPGDPCAGIGEGWDAGTATALGLLAADLAARGRLSACGAIAWAATSNGDSDSIATLAGALIGAANPAPGFWRWAGLGARFEDRYDLELARAATDGPPTPTRSGA